MKNKYEELFKIVRRTPDGHTLINVNLFKSAN